MQKKLEHDGPLAACRPDTWHVNNTKIANTLCSVVNMQPRDQCDQIELARWLDSCRPAKP